MLECCSIGQECRVVTSTKNASRPPLPSWCDCLLPCVPKPEMSQHRCTDSPRGTPVQVRKQSELSLAVTTSKNVGNQGTYWVHHACTAAAAAAAAAAAGNGLLNRQQLQPTYPQPANHSTLLSGMQNEADTTEQRWTPSLHSDKNQNGLPELNPSCVFPAPQEVAGWDAQQQIVLPHETCSLLAACGCILLCPEAVLIGKEEGTVLTTS